MKKVEIEINTKESFNLEIIIPVHQQAKVAETDVLNFTFEESGTQATFINKKKCLVMLTKFGSKMRRKGFYWGGLTGITLYFLIDLGIKLSNVVCFN